MSHAAARTPSAGFATLPDLASRRFGASVPAASDELFAERENLINPDAPRHDAKTFGHRGQVYDGWETRRRREPGHDWALVRLGIPGVIRGVIVDTAYFTGNFPRAASDLRRLAKRHPIVVGGFGDTDCNSDFSSSLMRLADANGISYLAWTWNTAQDYGGCANALLDGGDPSNQNAGYYNARPSGFGAGIRAHYRALNAHKRYP